MISKSIFFVIALLFLGLITMSLLSLEKSCISKECRKNFKGYVIITVNIKTAEATIGWGE